MPWPISNHESPDLDLTIPSVTAPHYLWAILASDGGHFRENDYDRVRGLLRIAVERFSGRATGGQSPNPQVSEQRLRTWKAAFEEMGLLTVDEDGVVRATRFGRAVVGGLEAVEDSLRGANHRIAELGSLVANRVLLAKPDGNGNPPAGVPSGADLHPLRAIWKAFRKLSDKLHWQDINRVLGHVHFERDVDAAIARIAQFRAAHPNGYSDPAKLDILGTVKLTDDPRHVTPWFNRAGLGGMLIPSEASTDGFRVLPASSLTVIDGLLGEAVPPPPPAAWTDRAAYIAYLMSPVEAAERPPVDAADQQVVHAVLTAVKAFGSRKFIVLSGLPGTGKTRLAKLVADQLVDGDPTRRKDIQFHESTAYEDFVEGFVPRPDGQGFERRDKTLRIINQRALDDPERTYVLVIEEFTRANAHAVMGELLTYIEHRGEKFTLAISQDETAIAPNLVVLATMNPRDRSALTLDDAVTRRMHRITVRSSGLALHSMLDGHLDATHLGSLRQWFEHHLDVLPFGHGIFAGAHSPQTLQDIWEGTVLPLLSDTLGRIHERFEEAHASFPFQMVAASEPIGQQISNVSTAGDAELRSDERVSDNPEAAPGRVA